MPETFAAGHERFAVRAGLLFVPTTDGVQTQMSKGQIFDASTMSIDPIWIMHNLAQGFIEPI